MKISLQSVSGEANRIYKHKCRGRWGGNKPTSWREAGSSRPFWCAGRHRTLLRSGRCEHQVPPPPCSAKVCVCLLSDKLKSSVLRCVYTGGTQGQTPLIRIQYKITSEIWAVSCSVPPAGLILMRSALWQMKYMVYVDTVLKSPHRKSRVSSCGVRCHQSLFSPSCVEREIYMNLNLTWTYLQDSSYRNECGADRRQRQDFTVKQETWDSRKRRRKGYLENYWFKSHINVLKYSL